MSRPENFDRLNEAIREILLDSSDAELREALEAAEVDGQELALRGRRAVDRALAATDPVHGLHRGFGVLIHLLRRKLGLSIDELAKEIKVDPLELARIENDETYEAQPRTIVQLEQFFKLPSRSLVVLSGSVTVDSEVREEAVRFAASAQEITALSRDEKRLLNRFVAFLKEHTNR